MWQIKSMNNTLLSEKTSKNAFGAASHCRSKEQKSTFFPKKSSSSLDLICQTCTLEARFCLFSQRLDTVKKRVFKKKTSLAGQEFKFVNLSIFMYFRAFWDENLNSSKKIQNSLKNDFKMSKNCLIFKISEFNLRPEMAENRPKSCSKLRVYAQYPPKKILWHYLKNWKFYPKNFEPPPKKIAFFFFFLGGGQKL